MHHHPEIGTLVRCRDRDWVVMPSDDPNLVLLRPARGGGERDLTGIYLPTHALRLDPMEPTSFPLPAPSPSGSQQGPLLIYDAARLVLRMGSGPFRSSGHINVRPQPYQWVPLVMALRQNPVRLLIADEIGLGKTIEAALIARELYDRDEVRRISIVCPSHLCDQWTREVREKIGLPAVGIRTGTIPQLERERQSPWGSIFDDHPICVVSTDLLLNDRVRDQWLASDPDIVIIDEVHQLAGDPRQADILPILANATHRHLVLVTATPMAAGEDGIQTIMTALQTHRDSTTPPDLARHIIRRSRADVQQWLGSPAPFAERWSSTTFFRADQSPIYHDSVQEILADVQTMVRTAPNGPTRCMRLWIALSVIRSLMSSPAAAEHTCRAQLGCQYNESSSWTAISTELAANLFDLDRPRHDLEPLRALEYADPALDQARFTRFAERLRVIQGDADPKLLHVIQIITDLLQAGLRPVVFCRYQQTATYLAHELHQRLPLPNVHVIAITSITGDDERSCRIAELRHDQHRVLVTTDSLGEGINLESLFQANVHYDIPWDDGEQRDGRIDRYGQSAPRVQRVQIVDQTHPIDTLILSMHGHHPHTKGAHVVATLFPEARECQWEHPRITPHPAIRGMVPIDPTIAETVQTAEVVMDRTVGNPALLAQFLQKACTVLGAPLQLTPSPTTYRVDLAHLPPDVRETFLWHMPEADVPDLEISVAHPVAEGVHLVGRLHPLSETIAEHILSMAIEENDERVPRASVCWSTAVPVKTVIVIVRVRFLIRHLSRSIMAEEICITGFAGSQWIEETEAQSLLETVNAEPVTGDQAQEELAHALELFAKHDAVLEPFITTRASELKAFHCAVRSTINPNDVQVVPITPADLLSITVLLPHVD